MLRSWGFDKMRGMKQTALVFSALLSLLANAGDVLFYTSSNKNILKNPRDFVHIVTEEADVLTDNYVEPIIEYGDNMSEELLGHAPTLVPSIVGNNLILDTTTLDDDATIYIDGDSYKDYLNNGKLRMKKKENQMIVFNFDEIESVNLGEFYVQYPDMSTYISQGITANEGGEEWIKSDTPTSKGDKNNAIDDIARHIVWNLNSVENVTLGMTTGMYLVPSDTSYTEIGATSSGWIISDGTVHNSGGEWHSVYEDLPDIDTVTLNASKTVDGKPAKAAQKFEFLFETYDPINGEWVESDPVVNNGATVSFEPNQLNIGWNVYRITESKIAEDTEGSYVLDENVYYAAVQYISMNSGQVTYAGLPKYYSSFDENAFDKDSTTITGVGGPLKKITFVNETQKSGLKIKKTVENQPETAVNDVFTFTLTLKMPRTDEETGEVIRDDSGEIVYDPVSGEFTITGVTVTDGTSVASGDEGTMTVTFTNGNATIKLKGGETAEIVGLPDGDLYTAAETGDLPDGVTLTSPEKDAEGRCAASETNAR